MAMSFGLSWSLIWITLTLAGGTQSEAEGSLSCLKGISGAFAGVTIPPGDIYLKEHDTLEIFCKVNLTDPTAQGLNASFINFTFLKATISPNEIEKKVLNESTAVVRVQNMNASSPYVTCELTKPNGGQPIPVCRNQVYVGYPPQKVENFRCISHEWKVLNCTWKKPPNPIETKYTITHEFRRNLHVKCPDNTTKPESCIWDGFTDPHYRFSLDPFFFRLNGTNRLKPKGNIWDYKFSLGAIIIPEKPTIHLNKLSSYKFQLNWTFEAYEFFKYGLNHELKVCHLEENEEKCDVTNFKTRTSGSKMQPFLLQNLTLERAYTNYTISVRMRSPDANETEEFWSEPAIRNITTDARPPDSSPNVDNSSFDTTNGAPGYRDVNIYWEFIPDHKKNGPGFNYSITVYENKATLLNITPDLLTESFAKFNKLRRTSSYHFLIGAFNRIGPSPNQSEIIVPSLNNLPAPPQHVSKIDFTNGSFDISWRLPTARENKSDIVSYTVFRCPSPRSYSCEGRLEWDRVPASDHSELMHMFYDSLDTNYQFAVSANTHKFGSGMEWATCSLVHGRVPRKLRTVKAEDPTESEVVITWNLDCAYRPGEIEGFEIRYCRTGGEHRAEICMNESKSAAVEGANHTTYKLVNLEPFSIYKIDVLILANNEIKSEPSDPIYARTSEGPPGKVEVVTVQNITRSSAVLRIQSPLKWNGVLREFRIHYSSPRDKPSLVKFPVTNASSLHGVTPEPIVREFTLTNLRSNTNFTAFVVACTTPTKCGHKSQGISFSTAIAGTNLTSYPRISWNSDGSMELEWDAPEDLQGPIDEFEILLIRNGETDGTFYTTEYRRGVSVFKKELPKTCEPSTNFTAQVRAVTRLPSETLTGAWSPPGNYMCGGNTSWVLWIIFIVIAILTLAILGWMTVRGYNYFRHVKDGLAIKLPPGLNSELNGFTHKPPPRSRSHENGKEMCAYPLQPTGDNSEESKDFLSSSDHNHGEAEESLIEKPYCPSPTNPLLGGLDFSSISTSNGGGIVLTGGSTSGCGGLPVSSHLDDSDSSDIRLSDFTSLPPDRCSSPTAYKKVGVHPNGTAVILDSPKPSTPPSSSESSPSHSQLSNHLPNHHPPPKLNGHLPPDVLTPSSPTSSLNPVFSRPPPVSPPIAPPAASSSYVKWTTFVPDMKTGEAPHESRQSPYCQVGILLDS